MSHKQQGQPRERPQPTEREQRLLDRLRIFGVWARHEYGAGWASAVGLVFAGVTVCVFAAALVVALLLEFIVTGQICKIVDESVATIGGRICGATSLLAFVVGFGFAVRSWRKLR